MIPGQEIKHIAFAQDIIRLNITVYSYIQRQHNAEIYTNRIKF